MCFFGAKHKVYNYSFYGVWRKLLLVFAKGESVAFFLHPSVVSVLFNIVHNHTSASQQELFQLAHKCPVLCNLIAAFPEYKIPDFSFNVFDAMLSICVKYYSWLYVVHPDSHLISLQNQPVATITARVALERYPSTVCTEEIIPELAPNVSGCNWLWPKIQNSRQYSPYMKLTTAAGELQTVIDNSTH